MTVRMSSSLSSCVVVSSMSDLLSAPVYPNPLHTAHRTASNGTRGYTAARAREGT
jgi:hypothetical protein